MLRGFVSHTSRLGLQRELNPALIHQAHADASLLQTALSAVATILARRRRLLNRLTESPVRAFAQEPEVIVGTHANQVFMIVRLKIQFGPAHEAIVPDYIQAVGWSHRGHGTRNAILKYACDGAFCCQAEVALEMVTQLAEPYMSRSRQDERITY